MPDILRMFSYPFMARAFAAGVAVALASSLLGVSLVLKRYSMIGDGLSHVSFGCLAIAAALNWSPLAVSLPVVTASAFLLLRLNESKRVYGDAAIALISTASLAVGVIVVSLTTGMNVDVYNYMFGSILSITQTDMILSIVIAVIVCGVFALLFHRIFAVTFDEPFSKATGLNTDVYNTLFALLTAVTIVVGMRLVGALLISGIIIFPPLAAMRVAKTFRKATVLSAIISVICFFAGLTMSFALNLPAGASVVALNAAVFIIMFAAGLISSAVMKRKV
ncbi:MAG: metal ABC transporter permease [Clostridiales bacterium]|jgi:ABC-type Mn2+/Zn2+ transport system permease subunit|nr:metal ABC transporter permease [Clostridiales bacterium]HOB63659.1 metal ABC transporter permease [Clostridia bacterium]HOK82214.1 metal ABC transporter permease [Clostridia bacterium]HOL61323.1 metal ABC transporter permease [Clostridia bacterium]HPO54028.1 metal ABC transporter permease [Clostridia bacterium]